MDKPTEKLKKIVENALPWAVLMVLLFYSYIDFFQHPYGFAWLPDQSIDRVFVQQPAPTLIVGDRLVQVGPLSWNAFHLDLRKTFFEGVRPGEITLVVVERNGQTLTIPWRLPGFNSGELWDQLTGQWILAYFFWVAGLLTVLFLRPKDGRWWLFLAFNFITAVWLVAGSGPSNYHLWSSALVLRMAIWLSLPIYLHLHWVFPRPLGKWRPLLVWIVYLAAVGMMIAQGLQLFSQNLYFLAFLLALGGSLILLIVHFFRQSDVRREVRLFAVLVFFAFFPAIVAAVTFVLFGSIRLAVIPLVGFAAVPFAYLYIAYRRQLGGLEMRVNRIVSVYFFIILLGILAIPLLAILDRWLPSAGNAPFVEIIAILVATTLSIWGFPRFQHFVEARLLGISTPSGQIQDIYSRRTTASTSISALIDLLREVMLPSLLVRQFLFLYFDQGLPKTLLTIGLDLPNALSDKDFSKVLALKELGPAEYLGSRPYPWVRLVLPLWVGKDLLGFWLFGRRDPDDFYSQHDLPMLQSLANQTAIALSNIIQTERLHVAYQETIKRSEVGRQHLALELHDSILNKLAALMMKLDDQSITPEFQQSYAELTTEIREMVKDLRPSMLNYGIQPALEGYADLLMDRLDGHTRVILDLDSSNSRYSPDVEQHLFRIVQEACENALRHANPTQVTISGRLAPDLIELVVQDNGTGFDVGEYLDMKSLEAKNHFGLIGMFERAELVGAEIKIESGSEMGTRVHLDWKPQPV
jgi:signal transduction histidine kinase